MARQRWQIATIGVLEDVFNERGRQRALHGPNDDIPFGNGPETRWLLPFTSLPASKIQGDLRAEYEDFEEENGRPTFVHILREEVAEAFEAGTLEDFERELVEVAAVAVNIVEHIRAQRKVD